MAGESAAAAATTPPTGAKGDEGAAAPAAAAAPSSSAAATTSSASSASSDQKTERAPGLVSLKRLENAVATFEGPAEKLETIKKLKESQVAHIQYEEQYRHEWNELKLKYLKLFRPLYQQRKAILTTATAAAAPAAAPPAEGETGGESGGSNVAAAAAAPQNSGTVALPGFWLSAMRNHVLINEMIESYDLPVLQHLIDIVFEWVEESEQASFKLDFYFSPNEYFENSVVTKLYRLEPSEEDDEEAVLTRTEGTTIQWKPQKNITEKVVTRKQRNKRTNQIRTVREMVEQNSFFNIFQTHIIPGADALESMDDSAVAELEMIVEAEFEVGCIFRDKIIPRALGWYLGVERDNDVDSDALSAGRNEAADVFEAAGGAGEEEDEEEEGEEGEED